MSSVIMISQRPAVDWYDYIGDPLIADAFMDRVRSKAYLLQLEGHQCADEYPRNFAGLAWALRTFAAVATKAAKRDLV